MTPSLTDPTDVLARTAWGENRSGGYLGMQSVANAVLNRVQHGGWWGSTIIGVCLAREQFSCWLLDDPNRAKLLAVAAEDPQFTVALNIAALAVGGTLEDVTGGADSYYAASMREPPAWAATARFTRQIAGQRFYVTV